MAPYFQLLLIAGVLYPMQMINVQVLSAQGKMKLSFKLSMFKNVLRVINIVIMYRFGVIYIIYGEIINSCLSLIINTYYTKKFVNYGILEQLKDISIILLIPIILTLLGFVFMDEIENQYLKIFSIILFIGSFYVLGMYLLNKKLVFDTFDIIKSKMINIKK